VKPLVFNSTPLIYLTKAGLSRVLEDLKGEKLTSPSVKREVVDVGKCKGVPDAFVLDRLFERHVVRVAEPKDRVLLGRLMETRGLHVTDAEVLALAGKRKAVAVVDDEVARKTAKVYGIAYVGTPYLLVRAVCEGIVSGVQAKRGVSDMVSAGWRCSVESYSRIMEAVEKVQRS